MVPPSSIEFIDAALSCTSPHALSYKSPDQKWVIRNHLISLLQDFPSLKPSMDTFFHNDGSLVNLLNANGDLHLPPSTTPIPLKIWIHENYPQSPPFVFVLSNSVHPILPNHPFVDSSSGATTSFYLQSWLYSRCNLSDLVQSLVKLFSHNHPFDPSTSSGFTHPSLVSKKEAIDRLACYLHYDLIALKCETDEQIEELSVLQSKMNRRANTTKGTMICLEQERTELRERVTELTHEADALLDWLKVYDKKMSNFAAEDAFEAVDEESKMVLNWLAEDRALEDLMYSLDKAIEQSVVSSQVYFKQVRDIARKQFLQRAEMVKLKGPQILKCLLHQ